MENKILITADSIEDFKKIEEVYKSLMPKIGENIKSAEKDTLGRVIFFFKNDFKENTILNVPKEGLLSIYFGKEQVVVTGDKMRFVYNKNGESQPVKVELW